MAFRKRYGGGGGGRVSYGAIKSAARQAANSAVRRVKGRSRKSPMTTKLLYGGAAAAVLYFTKDKWLPMLFGKK